MTEAMAKEMEKQAGKSKKDDDPKTEQEIENERLANVMDLSQGLQKAEVTDSVKNKVDGEARVLKPEIEQDQMYNPSADVADKEAKLAELEAPCHQPVIQIRLTRPSDIPVCLPAGSPAHRRSYPV